MNFDKLINVAVILGTIAGTIFLLLNVGRSISNDYKTSGMTPADFDAMKSTIEAIEDQADSVGFEAPEETEPETKEDIIQKVKEDIEGKDDTEKESMLDDIKETDN